MLISETLKPEFLDLLMEESLFDSLDTILKEIKECQDIEETGEGNHTGIYSYDLTEEMEKLTKLKEGLEVTIEWYVGVSWQSKFEEFLKKQYPDS